MPAPIHTPVPARIAVFVALAAPILPALGDTVITLGDSVGWGYTVENRTTPSHGDQPWVSLWADALAGRLGARPDVLNLAVPGEESATFFTGGEPGVQLNLNYDQTSPQTQAALFAQHAAALRASGERVRVALTLGANDLLSLLFEPGFLFASPEEQNAMIEARIAAFRPAYAQALALIAAELPGAELVVLNYYNPANAWLFDADPTNDALALLADDGIRRLNAAIADEAGAFDARIADIYAAFYGREGELTSLLTDFDVHPNLAGYEVIAGVVIPTPGGLAILATAALAGSRRRR